MSERVVAISSEVAECGKKISDSKKRFIWRFRIGGATYNLQLVSSALSGKRAISLNDQPIYSEQSVLNLNFDFTHNIQGHSLRIFRESESVHNYDLRIDNRSFEYLLKKKDAPAVSETKSNKYEATSNDPFSQFDKVASNSNNNSTDNQFGDFGDFSSFDLPRNSANQQKIQKKSDDFDFGGSRAPNAQNFETGNYNNLQKNLNNADLLSADNFTTNNYGNYNNFLDLIDSSQGNSQTWGQPVDPNKKQTFLQKITPDITAKQVINKTLMTAVQIKKKAVNQFQSLI